MFVWFKLLCDRVGLGNMITIKRRLHVLLLFVHLLEPMNYELPCTYGGGFSPLAQ